KLYAIINIIKLEVYNGEKKVFTKTWLLTLILVLVFSLTLTGCDNGSEGEEVSKKEDANSVKENTEKEKNEKEDTLIKVEDLPYEINILEPDSIGTRYMEATFTNNSDFTVTGYSLTILLKEENEKTYLGTYDTIMPGETSSKFESFAPESGKEEDMELLRYELNIKDEDGTEYLVEYDVKLEKYEVLELSDD